MLGDIASAVAPNSNLAKDLPNTTQDIINRRAIQVNPYISETEKLNSSLNEGRDLGINASINVGLAEFGYLLPRTVVSQAANKAFGVGSGAGTLADALQLSKVDLTGAKNFQPDNIGSIALGAFSLSSRLKGFDSFDLFSKSKNFKNLTYAEKKKLFEDYRKGVFNVGNAIGQQTQRVLPL